MQLLKVRKRRTNSDRGEMRNGISYNNMKRSSSMRGGMRNRNSYNNMKRSSSMKTRSKMGNMDLMIVDDETSVTSISDSYSSLYDPIEVQPAYKPNKSRRRSSLLASVRERLLHDYAIVIQSIVRRYLQRIKYQVLLRLNKRNKSGSRRGGRLAFRRSKSFSFRMYSNNRNNIKFDETVSMAGSNRSSVFLGGKKKNVKGGEKRWGLGGVSKSFRRSANNNNDRSSRNNIASKSAINNIYQNDINNDSSSVERLLKNHNASKKYLTDRILKTIIEEKSAMLIQATLRGYHQRRQYRNILLLIQTTAIPKCDNDNSKNSNKKDQMIISPRRAVSFNNGAVDGVDSRSGSSKGGIKRGLQRLKMNFSSRNTKRSSLSSSKVSQLPDTNLGIIFRKREQMLITVQAVIRGYLQRKKYQQRQQEQQLVKEEKAKNQQQQKQEQENQLQQQPKSKQKSRRVSTRNIMNSSTKINRSSENQLKSPSLKGKNRSANQLKLLSSKGKSFKIPAEKNKKSTKILGKGNKSFKIPATEKKEIKKKVTRFLPPINKRKKAKIPKLLLQRKII